VLPLVDSRLLGEAAGAMVILARAELTKQRNLIKAVNLIRHLRVPLMGAVLNHTSRRYFGLYYHYSYYHSYYNYQSYGNYYTTTDTEMAQEEETVENAKTEVEHKQETS
jgi:Mrp family chromosome partitioning ATPase